MESQQDLDEQSSSMQSSPTSPKAASHDKGSFVFEHAKSARATCRLRSCMEKIDKGTIRLGSTFEMQGQLVLLLAFCFVRGVICMSTTKHKHQ